MILTINSSTQSQIVITMVKKNINESSIFEKVYLESSIFWLRKNNAIVQSTQRNVFFLKSNFVFFEKNTL